jgi:hypothetical protein
MNYDLKSPCSNCPFLKRDGAVRLSKARAREIAGMMLSPGGGDFVCHKTSKTTSNAEKQSHCAGALSFALKNGNMTQMMRISERLGMFDPQEFVDGIDEETIVDSYREMVLGRGK